MTPENFLPAFPATKAALLTIDGLAVACFNRTAQPALWEVGFLRFPEHTLEIWVREQDQSGAMVGDQRYIISPTASTIVLQVENGSEAHYRNYPDGYFSSPLGFSRNAVPSDDFRWVIDFVSGEVPHGNFVQLKRKQDFPDRVDVTLLTIPYSLFYTFHVTNDPVVLAPQSANDPTAGFVFGKSDEILGGFVFTETLGGLRFVITDDNGVQEIVLPAVDGHAFQVAITNLDRPKREAPHDREMKANYVKGDFHYYYSVIEVDGEPQDLWAPPRLGPRGRDGDCHGIRVSLDSIASLLE